jgi:hypothetical protein
MISISTWMTTAGRVAATALLTVGLVGAGWAQEQGEGGGDDPIEELKKALEQMRSAEELLAQSSREKAAVKQDEVDKLLRKLLDDVELSQKGAARKMLLGAEKASLKIDSHIQNVINMAKFGQGQGGSPMETGQKPQGGGKPKQGDEMRKKDESQGQKQQKPGQSGKDSQGKEQKGGSKPGASQAESAYDAKTGKGRPGEMQEDKSAWGDQLPSKYQEDALKKAPDSWPGKYENLIRRWQKTLARLPARR